MAMADLEGPANFVQIVSSWRLTCDSELKSRPPHRFSFYGIINGKLNIYHPKDKAMPVGSGTFYFYEGASRGLDRHEGQRRVIGCWTHRRFTSS